MFRSFYEFRWSWRDYWKLIRDANMRARQAMNTNPVPRKVPFMSRAHAPARAKRTAASQTQRRQEKRKQFVQGVRAA